MPLVLNAVAVLLITLIAVIGLAAWLAAGFALRRRRPDPQSTPDEFDLPFEHVTFSARDGVLLGGRLTAEAGSKRPTVIFCAGMFGSMDGDTPMLPMFASAGFDVLQFDWRGHGISDGTRGTLGVREILDVHGAVDFLQSRGIRRIGLMGFSFGGAVALRAAAEDPRVACAACDGGYVNLQHAVEGFAVERFGRRARMFLRPFVWLVLRLVEVRLAASLRPVSPLDAVGRISPRPVLFVHGEDDPFVPVSDQDAIFHACGDPKQLWRVPGAGHREAHRIAAEEYRERVIGFFRAHLRG